MPLRTARWILTLAAAAALTAADTAAPAKVMLEAARKKEVVDGDLNGAIKQYAAIVAKYGKTDRAVSADALLHMAECHQKLGDAESRKLYEQVVRDYSDQKEAVDSARAHLGLGHAARTTGVQTREVWTGSRVRLEGSVSADGHYISFNDAGNLAIHDLWTGADRILVARNGAGDHAEESVTSRDGRQVAYAWWESNGGRESYTLMVLNLQPAASTPRRLYRNMGDNYIRPLDWSPDGKSLLVHDESKSRGLALISVADGSMRVLKQGPLERAAFSPDGKLIAYDHPAKTDQDPHDIFVMKADGTAEVPAVVHPANETLVGWSPDGSRILFTSNRSGTLDLWSVGMVDGKAQGAPEMLKTGFGNRPLGMSESGALFYGVTQPGRNVMMASLDFNTGQLLKSAEIAFSDHLGSNGFPDFSPDGKSLVHGSLGRGIFVIRSLESGKVRELMPQGGNFQLPRWSPDGRSLIVRGTDAEGRRGVFSLDLQTGQPSALAISPPNLTYWAIDFSRDGKYLYYGRDFGPDGGPHDDGFIEKDLASGAEREVFRRPGLGIINLSPDGKWIATEVDTDPKSLTLTIVPVNGGQPRELVQVARPEIVLVQVWAPDSNSLIYSRQLPGASLEWWQIPVTGGTPRKLSLDLGQVIRSIRVHPDGHRIAYTAGGDKLSVWVLENFLPRK